MLEVRVNLLGRRVYCQHCGGGFVAMDEQMAPGGGPGRTAADRADELLQRAAAMLERAAAGPENG